MKALLLLNGQPPATETFSAAGRFFTICADGAWNWASAHSIMPDIILGDMDSARVPCDGRIARIVYPIEKDQTDGDLALRYLAEHGYDEVDIYGAAGRRDDHYVANLGLLILAGELKMRAKVVTDYTDFVLVEDCFSANVKVGTLVSLVPFAGDAHIMNTEGLKYAVRDRTIPAFSSLGISNVATDERIKISVSSGKLLVFLVKRNEE